MQLKQTFVDNLRSMLREHRMTQTELAVKLGVTPAYVSHLLNGHRTPQLDTLEKLAKAMNCKPAEFLLEKVA